MNIFLQKNKNLLKQAGLAKKLIGQLFRNYTDYELSVEQYRKVKRELLMALTEGE